MSRETVIRHYGDCSSGVRGNEGTLQLKLAQDDARVGSTDLRERIEKAVFKFGWRHGITAAEARHLLLNTGVRLPA